MNNSKPIIYYHSVAPSKNTLWFRNYLTLELKYFEEHLKYFKARGYNFVFLKDIVDGSKDPDIHQDLKSVCLTFDDGYLDNFIYVYPLLKKYNAKATIFVNPAFVDKRSIVRKTLEDHWNNKASLEEINNRGFLNWEEMRLMEQSGYVDFQSHTMTHTKYFVSDKITGFHHPGADCLYYIGNEHSERLPYYIEDSEFEKLLPYGFPVFEERSSIIAKKVTINQSFIHSVIQLLKNYDWNKPYNFNDAYDLVKPLYDKARKTNMIIEAVETEEEYLERVKFELSESKKIIENELNKKVEICCWPHGDNSELTHQLALETGYKATSLGKMHSKYLDNTRFERFGLGHSKNNMILTRIKMHYKMESYFNHQPYYGIKNIYEFIRDRF